MNGLKQAGNVTVGVGDGLIGVQVNPKNTPEIPFSVLWSPSISIGRQVV